MSSIPFENLPDVSPLESLLKLRRTVDETATDSSSFNQHLQPSTPPREIDEDDDLTSGTSQATKETQEPVGAEPSGESSPVVDEPATDSEGEEPSVDSEETDEPVVDVDQETEPVLEEVDVVVDEEHEEPVVAVNVAPQEESELPAAVEVTGDEDADSQEAAHLRSAVARKPEAVLEKPHADRPVHSQGDAAAAQEETAVTPVEVVEDAAVLVGEEEPASQRTARRDSRKSSKRTAEPTSSDAKIETRTESAVPEGKLPPAAERVLSESSETQRSANAAPVEAEANASLAGQRDSGSSSRHAGSGAPVNGDSASPEQVRVTQAEQSRFIQRVARAFSVARGRGGELRLRLSPPHLGALRLEVKVQSGVLAARLEAETPQARTLLLENLPVLRERLAEQGIRVEQFDVDLMDRHGGQMPQDADHQGDSPRSQPTADATSRELTEHAATESTETRPADDGGLNVVV